MAYQVEIFGQTYSLRTDAEEEHVRRVADLVNAKMREVASGTRSVSTVHVAVLAALDLASERVQTEDEAKRLVADLEERLEKLARRVSLAAGEV